MYLSFNVHVGDVGSWTLEEGENLAALLNDIGDRCEGEFCPRWAAEFVESLDDDGRALLSGLVGLVTHGGGNDDQA